MFAHDKKKQTGFPNICVKDRFQANTAAAAHPTFFANAKPRKVVLSFARPEFCQEMPFVPLRQGNNK
jgi:hypothetical protein